VNVEVPGGLFDARVPQHFLDVIQRPARLQQPAGTFVPEIVECRLMASTPLVMPETALSSAMSVRGRALSARRIPTHASRWRPAAPARRMARRIGGRGVYLNRRERSTRASGALLAPYVIRGEPWDTRATG
jgi:hypothetical protein